MDFFQWLIPDFFSGWKPCHRSSFKMSWRFSEKSLRPRNPFLPMPCWRNWRGMWCGKLRDNVDYRKLSSRWYSCTVPILKLFWFVQIRTKIRSNLKGENNATSNPCTCWFSRIHKPFKGTIPTHELILIQPGPSKRRVCHSRRWSRWKCMPILGGSQ